MISFLNVTKKFGKKTILDNVSFSLADGEFVFLTGPTGSGKTTIIRLIIKDILSSEGKISILKWDLNKIQPKEIHLLRRQIGIIFQDLKLLPDKTLLENVSLSLDVGGVKPNEAKIKTKEILKFVGLGEKMNFFPQELSGGELQRAAIARAVVINPLIILADEPTADLDPATSWQIMQLFIKLNKLGKTILFATHNADIVNSLKYRVIKVKDGKIVKDEKKGKY